MTLLGFQCDECRDQGLVPATDLREARLGPMSRECFKCGGTRLVRIRRARHRPERDVACDNPECVERAIRQGAVSLLAAEPLDEGVTGAVGPTGPAGAGIVWHMGAWGKQP